MDNKRIKGSLLIGLAACFLVSVPLHAGEGKVPALSSVDMNQITVTIVPLSTTTVMIDQDVLFEVTIRNNYDSEMKVDLWFTVDLTGVDPQKRVSAPYLDRESPISGIIRGAGEVVLRLGARPLANVDPGAYTFYAKVGYDAIDFVKSADSFRGVILDRNVRDEEPGGLPDGWAISSAWAVNEDGQAFLAGADPSSRKAAVMVGNYPNPFHPSTTILYEVRPVQGLVAPVKLDVYDIHGRLVRNLVNAERAAGTYTVRWDGRDSRGSRVGSGIFLFRLQSGHDVSFKKAVMTE